MTGAVIRHRETSERSQVYASIGDAGYARDQRADYDDCEVLTEEEADIRDAAEGAARQVEPGSDLEWESLLSDHGSGIFEVDAVLRRRRMWRVTEPVLVERKERTFRWRSRVEMAS